MQEKLPGNTICNQLLALLFKWTARVSREALFRRLLVWTAALAFASTWAGTNFSKEIISAQRPLHSSLLVVSVCVGLTILANLLISFTISGKKLYAMQGIAFFIISYAIGLQALATIYTHQEAGAEIILNLAWIGTSLLLVSAARSHTLAQNKRRAHVAFRAFMSINLCILFPLTTILSIIDRQTVLFPLLALASSIANASLVTLSEIIAIGFIGAAIVAHYRRYKTYEDRTSAVICFFLLSCALSVAYISLGSIYEHEWVVIGQALSMLSLLTVVIGFGLEVAFSRIDLSNLVLEQETMHKILWSLLGSQSMNDMLNAFMENIQLKLNASVVALFLPGDSPDTLKIASYCGPINRHVIKGKHYPVKSQNRFPGFHSGHTAKAFLSGEIQIARDVFIEAELVPWQVVGREDGAAVSLPLNDEFGTLGVLAIYFPDHKQLTKQRTRLLSTLAESATPAIRNALGCKITVIDGCDDQGLDLAA